MEPNSTLEPYFAASGVADSLWPGGQVSSPLGEANAILDAASWEELSRSRRVLNILGVKISDMTRPRTGVGRIAAGR